MRELPVEPLFRRADLRPLGWSDPAIQRALRSGRLFQVRHGWLAADGADAERRTAIAAGRANVGSVLSHRSAAALHALPIVGPGASVPELTVRPRGTGTITGAHVHRATLAADDITLVDGVPVTSVA